MTDCLVAKAEATIANGSQSFSMAAKLLGREIRRDAVLLYAWCRHCDDWIDGQELGRRTHRPSDPSARLTEVRKATQAALDGRPGEPSFAALAEVVARHDIPHRYPMELINGFAMDATGRRYARIEDTLDYCYHVAGVVGVMMAMIMGVRDAAGLDRASDLGIAFQLTNIARDVVEDAETGRIYLPEETRAARGLAPDDVLTNPANWPAAQRAACDLLHLSERYYASGLAGLSYLPRDAAWGIASARRIYREIGVAVRHATPREWAGRVSIGSWRKAQLALTAIADPYRSKPVSRAGLWARPAADPPVVAARKSA